MIVPIDRLKPGDAFIEPDPDPQLDVNFVVKRRDFEGNVVPKTNLATNFTSNQPKWYEFVSNLSFKI